MRAYLRDEQGLIIITSVHSVDGELYTRSGNPIQPTDEIGNLLGWPDGKCRVYVTEVGHEILVPIK